MIFEQNLFPGEIPITIFDELFQKPQTTTEINPVLSIDFQPVIRNWKSFSFLKNVSVILHKHH